MLSRVKDFAYDYMSLLLGGALLVLSFFWRVHSFHTASMIAFLSSFVALGAFFVAFVSTSFIIFLSSQAETLSDLKKRGYMPTLIIAAGRSLYCSLLLAFASILGFVFYSSAPDFYDDYYFHLLLFLFGYSIGAYFILAHTLIQMGLWEGKKIDEKRRDSYRL